MSSIKDPSLAPLGLKRIAWVKEFMPCLRELEERFKKEQPFKGMKIAVCVHLEAKTAYLGLLLRAGGAEVVVTGSNPLSTKDDICAALDSLGVEVHAWFGATDEEYEEHIRRTLEFCPHIIIDDGGDFVAMLTETHPEYAKNLIGGCEETTTGIHRLRAREAAGTLTFPMMAVNDANCKHLFDNRHGTGQSVWDAIMYTTNNMVTGRTVVVAGYGFCSSGIANRAKGLGRACILISSSPSFHVVSSLTSLHSLETHKGQGFHSVSVFQQSVLQNLPLSRQQCPPFGLVQMQQVLTIFQTLSRIHKEEPGSYPRF